MQNHPGAINTGIKELDGMETDFHWKRNVLNYSAYGFSGTLSVLLGTTILVGGCLGCLLDNLIPGSRCERGLDAWEKEMSLKSETRSSGEKSTYDFPYGMSLLYRYRNAYLNEIFNR